MRDLAVEDIIEICVSRCRRALRFRFGRGCRCGRSGLEVGGFELSKEFARICLRVESELRGDEGQRQLLISV